MSERNSQASLGCAGRSRRGVAVLIVLLLVSVTLGLSYVAVRAQFQSRQIQENAGRRTSARHLAVTGLTAALKRMHTSDWEGVDTTYSKSLSEYESFQVTYTTGDPSLSAGDADYDDLPYRVTLLATGSVVDPDNSASIATHQIRAVVQLIPRALADEPSQFSEMTKYSLYQTSSSGRFYVDSPVRLEDSVRVRGQLLLGRGLDWPEAVRQLYLTDLDDMRRNGYGDHRPFGDWVVLEDSRQEAGLVSLLYSGMGVSVSNQLSTSLSDWSHPGSVKTYQIYPGGTVYRAVLLSQNHSNTTLEPDPETNPLGIYYREGELQLHDNVTVRGTLLTRSGAEADLHFYGRGVELQPLDLPALEGTDQPVRLPVAVVGDDVRLERDCQATVTGMILSWDEFEYKADDYDDVDATFQGTIVAREFMLREREDWDQTADWWQGQYDDFAADLDDPDYTGTRYFPDWLHRRVGLNPAPRVTVKPDPTPARYHWHNLNSPLYVPHEDDEGLRWDLLEWTEDP